MIRPRAEFGVTLLANGHVLVAGGCTAYDQNGCAATTTGAEIYDPATGLLRSPGRCGSDARKMNLH